MPAQFSADLNPKQSGMSLGDMMKIGLYSAETDVLNRQAQVAREKEKELPIVQGFISDPKNKDEKGKWDLDKVNTILPTIAPITGPDFAKKLTDGAINHAAATKAKMELSGTARGFMASLYGSYAQGNTQDPKEVMAGMAKLGEQMPELRPYIEPALRNLQNVPAGPEFTKALYKARDEFLTPTQQIEQFAPKAGIGEVGGAKVQTVTTPSFRGSQPTVTTSPLGGGTPMQPNTGTTTGTTTTNTSSLPKLISEDKNLNYTGPANPLNLSDLQKDRYVNGQKDFDAARVIQAKQKDLQQAVRKVEEFMGSASGSKGYQMVQQAGKWVFGNSDLDSLVKNIAQVQARNAEVMGLTNNIPAQELNAKLSGSEKIDEKALAGVMQQVKAESKAVELYSQGLKKFVEKRGDVNGFIQANKFQSAWSEHYDPRIFQVDNIASSNMPETEKSAKIKDITSRMSDDEFTQYKKDRVVIHRLSKGLYQ
jgi:hypothetical protein